MRKRTFVSATALTGLAVGLALAGCSGGGDAGSKTLTVLTYQPADSAVYTDFFASCKKATGYTFKPLSVTQAQLVTKATQMTASGDAPAIILADNSDVATLAAAGVLSPLELGDLKASDFVKGPLEAGQYKGTQYALPVGNNGEQVVYNKTLLDAAGLPVPKTWEQLQKNAKALTVDGRYGFGQVFPAGETLTWNYVTQLWSNGGSLKDLSSDEAVEAATFWTSFLKDGTAPQASYQWQSPDIATQFVDGHLAMAQIGTWALPALADGAKKAGIEWGLTPQVTRDGSAPIIPFGGEEMAVGKGASAAGDAVSTCIQSWSSDPAKLAERAAALGYLPSYIPAQAATLEKLPYLQVFADELKNSRSRTEEVGADYPKVSAAISTALQKIAQGSESAEAAMTQAAESVK